VRRTPNDALGEEGSAQRASTRHCAFRAMEPIAQPGVMSPHIRGSPTLNSRNNLTQMIKAGVQARGDRRRRGRRRRDSTYPRCQRPRSKKGPALSIGTNSEQIKESLKLVPDKSGRSAYRRLRRFGAGLALRGRPRGSGATRRPEAAPMRRRNAGLPSAHPPLTAASRSSAKPLSKGPRNRSR
jgi:hypothetical protein